jgi:tetracycline repressor-like protein
MRDQLESLCRSARHQDLPSPGRYPRFVETLPGHLQRLPAGQDRFQAELLSHDQRGRILVAMASEVAERGYHKTTIEHIVKRAGVSRATFY